MTGSDDPLKPAEEEVRRLLAEARHTGPTPPDVVARLDRVLDDLAKEPNRVAPVVDLARRRRRAASLLVAAAAVVAVGVGLSQVVTPQSGSDSVQAGAGSQAQEETQDSEQPKTQSRGAESADEPAPAPVKPQPKSTLATLRRTHLASDLSVARELRSLDSQASSSGAAAADRAAGAACAADQWGRGRFVPASYGGAPAVVVFRRPVGETQVADVFLCGSEEPVRSVTLPAP